MSTALCSSHKTRWQHTTRCATRRGGRCRMVSMQGLQGAGSLDKPLKVVGVGSCGVDYLASVASYPRPDEKLRTEQLEVQGGGNAANALTAAARLGLMSTLVTKIGGDGLGDGIVDFGWYCSAHHIGLKTVLDRQLCAVDDAPRELERDGIDTTHVLRATGQPSPFTYIIVDRSGGTRTCIHTPGASLTPSDMTHTALSSILADAAVVYFDGRLTEAALVVARAAKAANIPLLVEAERLRNNLGDLLALADVVVTSAHFPQEWTGEAELGDALLTVAARLPQAKTIITTRGSRGAVMLQRGGLEGGSHVATSRGTLVQVIADLEAQLNPPCPLQSDCISASGVSIARGDVARSQGVCELTYSPARDAAAAAAGMQGAAARAAALNADARNASCYTASQSKGMDDGFSVTASVAVASSACLPKEFVVDTTGAGDAFIGSVLFGLATGMPMIKTITLASVVAACKCTALGARPGLPRRCQLAEDLL